MHLSHSAALRPCALNVLRIGVVALALNLSALADAPLAASPVGAVASVSPGGVQSFTLPKLPCAYDALEPYFEARALEVHLTQQHQAYVNAVNKALEARPDLREITGEQLIARLGAFDEPLRTTLRNQLGGHLNHSFFWKLLAAPAEYRPGALRAAIDKEFGSLEAFQAEFAQAAKTQFGSGWVWLVWQAGQLKVITTQNEDSPLMQGAQPVIGLDLWEHAYHLAYQNRRADYVRAFWKVLNWEAAEAIYANVGTL